MHRGSAEHREVRGRAKPHPRVSTTPEPGIPVFHIWEGKKENKSLNGNSCPLCNKGTISKSKSRFNLHFGSGSCLYKYQLHASPCSASRPLLEESHSSVHFFCRYSRRRQVSTAIIGIPLDATQKYLKAQQKGLWIA